MFGGLSPSRSVRLVWTTIYVSTLVFVVLQAAVVQRQRIDVDERITAVPHRHRHRQEPAAAAAAAAAAAEVTSSIPRNVVDSDGDDNVDDAASTAEEMRSCPGCRQQRSFEELTPDEIIQLRIERIKRDILDKLGLRSPPNVTRLPAGALPAPLRKDLIGDEESDDVMSDDPTAYEEDDDEVIPKKRRKIVVFGEGTT